MAIGQQRFDADVPTVALRFRLFIALAGLSLMLASDGQSAPPPLDYLFPAGGQAGTMFQVEAGGKFDDWPVDIWIHPSSGVDFVPEEEKGKFSVTIGASAALGPRWVRFYNAQGASDPRLLFVGKNPEILEESSNDTIQEAQTISRLPLVINGRLEKRGDVDCYAVRLKAGQWIVAQLDAYTLDSPLDPLLHLTDMHNSKRAFQHDGCRLDPRMAWMAEHDGTYVIKVAAFAYPPRADVEFAGEASAVYRLNLFDGPCLDYPFPPVFVPGMTNRWRPVGWNLPVEIQEWISSTTLDSILDTTDRVWLSDPVFQNVVSLPVASLTPSMENEPNDNPEVAREWSIPFSICGRLEKPADVDYFRFKAESDETIRFEVQSASLGFPVDPVVVIQDSEGKELVRHDDSEEQPDPSFQWKSPGAGSYLAMIQDRFGRGGFNHVYRIAVSRTRPDFEATLEGLTFAVDPGEEVEFKMNVKRLNGYEGKLVIEAEGLPEGLTGDPVEVPEKGGEVILKARAAADAPPTHACVRFRMDDPDDEPQRSRWVQIPVKGKHAEAGDLMLNRLPSAWLTVRPKTEDKLGH